jgi:hypothetical protein
MHYEETLGGCDGTGQGCGIGKKVLGQLSHVTNETSVSLSWCLFVYRPFSLSTVAAAALITLQFAAVESGACTQSRMVCDVCMTIGRRKRL